MTLLVSICTGTESSSKSAKPVFVSIPFNKVTVELGNSTNLTCGAAGHPTPTPTFEWYKDGVLIWEENEPSLFISEVLPDDRGKYFCRTINSEGIIIESHPTQLLIPRTTDYYCMII